MSFKLQFCSMTRLSQNYKIIIFVFGCHTNKNEDQDLHFKKYLNTSKGFKNPYAININH